MSRQQAEQLANEIIDELRSMRISPGESILLDYTGAVYTFDKRTYYSEDAASMILFTYDKGECYFPVSHLNEYNELELAEAIVDFLTQIES